MTKIKTLDLFSGIGGFSYALKSIAKTVAYCEIDEGCRAVLRANMRRKRIHPAPIYDDVKALSIAAMRKLRPEMITAGFPCQDISVANPGGAGLNGARSGLFREIVRLVDGLPTVKLVFLENSSNILKTGYKTLKRQMAGRGFAVRYVLVRASEVGALHKRLRWFCLCYKPTAVAAIRKVTSLKLMGFKWACASRMAKVKRIRSPGHKAAMVKRCAMLGNSIVPQAAIWAWNLIAHSIAHNDDECVASHTFKKQQKMRLVFSDGRHKTVKGQWATPVHSVWHNYTRLTPRGSRLLSNQTFYFEGRINKSKYNQFSANPQFVENLMGYPPGYTLTR